MSDYTGYYGRPRGTTDTVSPTIPSNAAGGGTAPPGVANPVGVATPRGPEATRRPAQPATETPPASTPAPPAPPPPAPSGPATNPFNVADPTYVPKGQEMLAGAEQSYGKNATDTLNMATAAGRQFGDIAAGEGGRAATGYARASGLSPAQAALLAGQGAEGAYSGGLGQGVDKYMGAARDISSLGLAEQGQGLQKYGLDLGKYGTDVSSQGNKYSTDVGAQQEKTKNESNMWGTLLSAGAPVVGGALGSIFGPLGTAAGAALGNWAAGQFGPKAAKDGMDSSPGGLTIVGEEGPELINLPAGSQVVPHEKSKKLIKDGYDILSAVSDAVGKRPAKVEKLAQVSITSAPAKPSKAEMSDKLDKVFQYLKAQ